MGSSPTVMEVDPVELARLRAIERRLRLLLEGSDEWAVEILNPGPGWETAKAIGCVRDLRRLLAGESASDVTWGPVG